MNIVINILLLPLYLSLSVGMPVLVHTCGTDTTTTVMPLSTEDPCGTCCGDTCCRLELKVLHIDDSQIQSQKQQEDNYWTSSILNPAAGKTNHFQGNHIPIVPPTPSPPGVTPKHILNCALLI